MPNGTKLKSLAWNSQQGWLSCGGEQGLLKVLVLDSVTSSATDQPSTMNQTLEGHHGAVMAIAWNQNYRKLTTSDDQGLVIVWVLHKGMWFEEMVNNRNKSVVKDLRWSSDGQKICIVYEDGQVVMGNVDGNRLWGKDISAQLRLVEWSPDGKLILFCTFQGSCLIHDCNGNYVAELVIYFVNKGVNASIAGIEWYNGVEGNYNPSSPALALALVNGKLQLMRHELDEEPVLVDTRMTTTCMKWSPDGEVLAVVGFEMEGNNLRESMVQLYSSSGIHLRTLHVPGVKCSAVAWEGGGLRLAVAAEGVIYFANIRPEYKRAFFGSCTCVYGFKKQDHTEHSVMFWNIVTHERYCKYVNRLVAIAGGGEHCVLATTGELSDQCVLILCNAIGSPVDSITVSMESMFITMNSNYVFVASEQKVVVWSYKRSLDAPSFIPPAESEADALQPSAQEHIIYIEVFAPDANAQEAKDEMDTRRMIADHICCICCSEKYLMVGQESGILNCYQLPFLRCTKGLLECRPQALELNCDSTRLTVIDVNGILTFYDVADYTNEENDISVVDKESWCRRVVDFERKDVWDMKWASDNPTLLAVMEKMRMYILRGTDPEEPVSCTAYLCNFINLRIQAVQLDEVMKQPDQPKKEHVFNYETKSLRDTRQMLRAVDIQDAFIYVEEHSHPRLWTSLAEYALEILNLPIAEKAFVKSRDYSGIQFVKDLHVLKDEKKQKAQVHVYFQQFDAAEKLYLDIDRIDLAIDLRIKLGDWFIVETLIKRGSGNDSLLELTWNSIGNYYADRQNWGKASTYYAKANNSAKAAECFHSLQDWQSLRTIMESLHDGSPLLLSLGNKFASVGICEDAVTCFVRGGDINSAINCCMELNYWRKALELAKSHDCERLVLGTLTKYTNYLVQSKNPLHAVEIFQRSGQRLEAAKILTKLARRYGEEKANATEAKKLFVLAALEIKAELDSRTSQRDDNGSTNVTTASTLEGFLQVSVDVSKHEGNHREMANRGRGMVPVHVNQHEAVATKDQCLGKAWHGAEAYHLWLLAHRELYAGRFEQAMKISWWLRAYEDVLSVEKIYSLVALTTFYNKYYAHCSQAFVKLEALKDIATSKQNHIADLALKIFTQHPPISQPSIPSRSCEICHTQAQELNLKCSNASCQTHFKICMASGDTILGEDHYQCTVCKHWMMMSRMKSLRDCPLCHSSLRSGIHTFQAKGA